MKWSKSQCLNIALIRPLLELCWSQQQKPPHWCHGKCCEMCRGSPDPGQRRRVAWRRRSVQRSNTRTCQPCCKHGLEMRNVIMLQKKVEMQPLRSPTMWSRLSMSELACNVWILHHIFNYVSCLSLFFTSASLNNVTASVHDLETLSSVSIFHMKIIISRHQMLPLNKRRTVFTIKP